MSLIFEKYHGFGTNYLIYDINRNKDTFTIDAIQSLIRQKLCYGLVAILVGPYKINQDYTFDIYQGDGSKRTANLLDMAIYKQYLIDKKYVNNEKKRFYIDYKQYTSKKGGLHCMLSNSNVATISMNDISFHSNEVAMKSIHGDMINIPFYFAGREYWGTCLSLSGTHLVIPMEEIHTEKIKTVGALAENSKYFTNSVSTELVKVVDRNTIVVEMYEAGIGYVSSSIPCASAAAAAMHKLGLVDKDVTVIMQGGKISITLHKEYDMSITGSIKSIGQIYLMNELVKDKIM